MHASRLAVPRPRAAAQLAAVLACLFFSSAHAQDGKGLTEGDALVTGFSGAKTKHVIDIDGASLRVLGLPKRDGETGSQKFTVPARQIGQVFGIALDDASAPNAYVTATSLYGLNIAAPNAAGTGIERVRQGRANASWMQGQWGDALKGGPGSIFKIDGETGKPSLFANIPLDGIPNAGAGLGNISFDARSRNLYVSDRETGIIFRLDLDGNMLGEFDHGVFGRRAIGLDVVPYDPLARADIKTSRFRSDDPETWGLPVLERRVFGLAAWRGRLYYAVADGPQIWSVPIDAGGNFGQARFETNLPDDAGDFEVSDIAFLPGGDMLLALRGAPIGAADYSGKAAKAGGTVLRYRPQQPDDEAPGHWVSSPEGYYVGQAKAGSSGDGGVALSAEPCAGTVWATGTALTAGRTKIDGLQGVPADTASEDPKPPRDALTVDFDNADPSTGRSGYLGDVTIVRTCEGGPSGYADAQLAEAREQQDGPESGGPNVGGGPDGGPGGPGGGIPGQPADPRDALEIIKTGSSCRFGGQCGFNITFANTGDQTIVFDGIARDELRRHHDGAWINANLVPLPGSLSFCSATPNALPFDCPARLELAPGESHTFGVLVEMNDPALDPSNSGNHGPGGVVQLRNCFVLDSQAGSVGPTCATVVVDAPDAEQPPDPVANKFGLQKTCGAFDANGKAKCQVSIIPPSTRIDDAISVTLRDEVTYRTDNGVAGVANLGVWDFCDYPSANVALCSFRAENLMPREGNVPRPLNIVVDVDRPRDATQGVLKNCVTLDVWGPGDQQLREHEPAEVCAEIALDAPPAAAATDLKLEKTVHHPCSRANDSIICGFLITLSNPTGRVFNGMATLTDTPSGISGGEWSLVGDCSATTGHTLFCDRLPSLEPGASIQRGGALSFPADQDGRTQFTNCAYLYDGTSAKVQEHCIDVALPAPPQADQPALTVRKKGPGGPCPEDGNCQFTVEIANEGTEPYQGEIGLVDLPVLAEADPGTLEVVRIDSGVCIEAALPAQRLTCRVLLALGPQGSGRDVKSFRVWVRSAAGQIGDARDGRNCVTIGTRALADTQQGQALNPADIYHHACAGFELEVATPTVPELTKTARSETCVYGAHCTFDVTIKNPSNVVPLVLDGQFNDRPRSGFYVDSRFGPFDGSILTLPITAMDGDICGNTPPLSAEFICDVDSYTLAPGEERTFTMTLRLNDPTLDPDGPFAAGREVRVNNCLYFASGAKTAHGCSDYVPIVSGLPEGGNEKNGVRVDKTCPVCTESKLCRCNVQVTVPQDVPGLSYLTVNDTAQFTDAPQSFTSLVLHGQGTDPGWSCSLEHFGKNVQCALPALALRNNAANPRVYNLAIDVARAEGRTDSIRNCAILKLFDRDDRPLSDIGLLRDCALVVIGDVGERAAELPVREPDEGCADGFDWDEGTGRCTPDGSWNPEEDDGPFGQAEQPLTAEDGCPEGFHMDETRGRCRPGDGPEQVSEPEDPGAVIPGRPGCTGGRVPRGDECVCPAGTEWSAKAGRCREVRPEEPQGQSAPSRPACPSGTSYDPDKRKCVSNCRAGQVWDKKRRRCVTKRPDCPSGTSYDPDKRKCVSNCRTGQVWDPKRKRCVTPPAKLTCLNGGEVRGKICWCGFGRFPFPVPGRKNTFECRTIEDPKEPEQESRPEPREPSIVCTNGRVRGGKCRCRTGFVLEKTGPNAWKCFKPYEGGIPPGTSSSGKGPSTSGGGKEPSGGGVNQTRPNASTPKPAEPKPQSNRLICRGGKVQGNLCWCGFGKFPRKVPGTANTWQCR